jgi:crotonobetainyl-CoA hydratase
MELLFTGRWFDVNEAYKWGLINEIVPKEELLFRAWKLAETLATGPPLVYAAIKEIAREAENQSFLETMKKVTSRQLKTVDKLYSSEDQLEGARAFSEKRSPVWKGK